MHRASLSITTYPVPLDLAGSAPAEGSYVPLSLETGCLNA